MLNFIKLFNIQFMITKFSILLLYYLCSFSLTLESIVPQKSPNDSNQYQALVLQNQLKILFIKDNQTEKSSCAILVGVGSSYNPQNAPRLAHFLQHMLFMGSKKYPSETQFSNFIRINSGSRNAQTSSLHTAYYFEVKNNAFGEGVQRLVDFFLSPLIKQSGLQKERLAVNNQFSLGLGQDLYRKSQILKLFAQPPYSYFSTGNNQTLYYPSVREDLVKFYNDFYSSNIMTAVVYSNQSLNTMKQKYIPIFSQIPNKGVKKRQFKEDFKKQNLGKLIRVESVKDDKTMDIYWIVQNLLKYYKTHLSQYIQYITNSQIPGSLRYILVDAGYVSSFNSGFVTFVGSSAFYVSVRLTEVGLEKYAQVYNIIINYVRSIKFQRYIYDQIRIRNQLSFKFAEKSSSNTDSIKNIAILMNKIPVQQVLSTISIFEDFENAQKMVNIILDQVRAQNMIVMLTYKKSLNNSKQEKYYKGKYTVEPLPATTQSRYSYTSPEPNPFLPIDTRVAQFQQKTRQVKKLGENIYFMQDSSFNVPKGGIELRVYGNENILFLNFYAEYLNLALKQDLDTAEMLMTSVTFNGVNSLIIKIFGFRDIAIKILQKIIQRIFVIQYGLKNNQTFNNVKKGLLNSYSNYYNKPSIDIANSILTTILTKGYKTQQEQAEEYKNYEYFQILNRINRFWVKTFARWVFVGNFYEEDIKWLTRKVQLQINGYRRGEVPSYPMIKLNKNIVHEVILENSQSTTSCALVYYQLGQYSQKQYYQVLFLKQMTDQPFFDKLRTQKQLAYRLGIVFQNLRNILGLRFFLVSATNDPKNISQQIKQFVNSFYGEMIKYLTQNKEQKFIKIKESLKTTLRQPSKSMSSLFSFIIDEVRLKTFVYNRKDPQYINDMIQSIKVADLKQMWDKMKQYTAEIYVVAQKHKQNYFKRNVSSMNINDIKNSAEYYEDKLRQT